MRPRERRETGEQDLFRSRLDQIIDIANYLSVPATLSKDLIDRAAFSYFVNF